MAKYPSDPKDPYVDPTTGVLRNRLGISDQAELDRVEATFAAVHSYELAINPVLAILTWRIFNRSTGDSSETWMTGRAN